MQTKSLQYYRNFGVKALFRNEILIYSNSVLNITSRGWRIVHSCHELLFSENKAIA